MTNMIREIPRELLEKAMETDWARKRTMPIGDTNNGFLRSARRWVADHTIRAIKNSGVF